MGSGSQGNPPQGDGDVSADHIWTSKCLLRDKRAQRFSFHPVSVHKQEITFKAPKNVYERVAVGPNLLFYTNNEKRGIFTTHRGKQVLLLNLMKPAI